MKISEKIAEIISLAENKFDVGKHTNDNISVFIFVNREGMFQVGLERPFQQQLNAGEVENASTIKMSINHYGFFTIGETLPEALNELYQAVDDAEEYEFRLSYLEGTLK
jgi:hypothetical protein